MTRYSARIKKITFIGLLCLAVVLGCTDQHTPTLSLLEDQAVILAFGDSLTYGTGSSREQSYPAVLAELSGYTVINAGVPGEVTTTAISRLPALLEQHKPGLLLLCHGGNDMLRKIDPAITRSNIEAMVDAAAARGIPTLLIGVPRPGLIFLETAKIYYSVAEKYGLAFQGDILASVESDNRLKSDRIHPNAAGYKQIAEALYHLMKTSGAVH